MLYQCTLRNQIENETIANVYKLSCTHMHVSGLITNGHNKHQIYKKIPSSAYTDTYYHTTWPLIFILYQERIIIH